jgi:hypothetical protein
MNLFVSLPLASPDKGMIYHLAQQRLTIASLMFE